MTVHSTARSASATTARLFDAVASSAVANPVIANPIAGSLNEAAAATGARAHNGAVLTLEGICLSFGGVNALTDVDLSVNSGEIRAIIGPNGAGKSSLINIISGIYKPKKGVIRLDSDTFSFVPTERLAHLGVARTFQNIALFKGLSVFDNIVVGRVSTVHSTWLEQVFGLSRARKERAATEAKVEEALEHMRLNDVRDRLPSSLSYGMQKRVELARAIVLEPRLLLLDEPMAGLTGTEKEEMSLFIREARSRYGTTVVLIEHDIGVVMGLSDQVTVFDYGRKISEGTPAQVMNDSAVIDAYLGVPHEPND